MEQKTADRNSKKGLRQSDMTDGAKTETNNSTTADAGNEKVHTATVPFQPDVSDAAPFGGLRETGEASIATMANRGQGVHIRVASTSVRPGLDKVSLSGNFRVVREGSELLITRLPQYAPGGYRCLASSFFAVTVAFSSLNQDKTAPPLRKNCATKRTNFTTDGHTLRIQIPSAFLEMSAMRPESVSPFADAARSTRVKKPRRAAKELAPPNAAALISEKSEEEVPQKSRIPRRNRREANTVKVVSKVVPSPAAASPPVAPKTTSAVERKPASHNASEGEFITEQQWEEFKQLVAQVNEKLQQYPMVSASIDERGQLKATTWVLRTTG